MMLIAFLQEYVFYINHLKHLGRILLLKYLMKIAMVQHKKVYLILQPTQEN